VSTILNQSDLLPPAVLEELEKSLAQIQYGSIEIVIHAGKIMEIIQHRRRRFATQQSRPPEI
jgi:hypothetical protein